MRASLLSCFTHAPRALYLVAVLLKKTIAANEIAAALQKMAEDIAAAHAQTKRLILAGIADGGIPVCDLLEQKISQLLGRRVSKATIDISFFRDDISIKPITKDVHPTHMAADPEEATIILVDDVLFTGRSVRAAMAEVLAIGRPAKIEMATLIDRGNRVLPIFANYVGIHIETLPAEKIKVTLGATQASNAKVEVFAP